MPNCLPSSVRPKATRVRSGSDSVTGRLTRGWGTIRPAGAGAGAVAVEAGAEPGPSSGGGKVGGADGDREVDGEEVGGFAGFPPRRKKRPSPLGSSPRSVFP